MFVLARSIEIDCSSKEWILTDFFDTLVHRSQSKEDVRNYWARNLAEVLHNRITPGDILAIRKEATVKLAESSCYEELRYKDIVAGVYHMIHGQLDVSEEEFIDICTKLEVEAEEQVLFQDADMVIFLEKQRSEGKKIAIVSDYYMSSMEMLQWLKKFEIEQLFDEIFISSDYGKKKQTGHLYSVVIEKLGDPKRMIMLGDNQIADVKMAEEYGVDACYLPWNTSPTSLDINKKLRDIYKVGTHVPFSNYAFLMYLYMERMYKRLLEIKPRKVFFLAREGYILQQLFEKYQQYHRISFDTDYLYLSRKATLLASLKGADEVDFHSIFVSYRDLDVISFLRNLSFTEEEVREVVKDLNFSVEEIIYNFDQSQELQELINNKTFKQIIDKKCWAERKNLRQYMEEKGVDPDDEIVLVDVGWKGTIQDNIYLAFEDTHVVRGLYIGFENATGIENYRNIKEGLIFSKYPLPTDHYGTWDFETHLIEQLLAAPHGSAAGFADHGTIIPILEKYSPEDRELYECVSPSQQGIIKQFELLCETFNYSTSCANEMYLTFLRYHVKAMLILNKDCIRMQRIMLTPSTNNFGWFKRVPTRTSKKQKFKSMLKDIKKIHKHGHGFMSYVSYLSIKMNARHKYNWKLLIYRIVYVIDCFIR